MYSKLINMRTKCWEMLHVTFRMYVMVNIDNNETMGILELMRHHINYETKDLRTLPAISWTGFYYSHTAPTFRTPD